jgi:subtilisin family serine protease
MIDREKSIDSDLGTQWWEHWPGDNNHNGLEDTIENMDRDTVVDILIDFKYLPGTTDIEALKNAGVQVTYISKYINTVAAREVPVSSLQDILLLPGVVMIERQAEYVPLLDVSVPAMKVGPSSTYTNVARDFGVTGDGIVIAIIDTGVDDDHDSLEGKFIAGADFSGGIISFKNPDDKEGHGTHVAGTAMGTGGNPGGGPKYIGVAPDADLVDVKVFNDWSPTTSSENVMLGIEWCIDNKGTYDIDILSLSIGELIVGDDDGSGSEAQLLDRAVDNGLVVVVAAGNEGPDNNGFSSLAAAEKVITVGAIEDKNTISRDDDTIAEFSNRGPRADDGDTDRIDEYKPDVSAPGVDIDSALYAASYLVTPGNGYTEKSGTSMAAPHVAGLAALLLEANPSLTPDEVKTVIRETATSKGSPYNKVYSDKYNKDFGWGIVDGYSAVKRAQGDFQRAEITSFEVGDTIGGIVEIDGTASNDKGAIVRVELSFDEGDSWSNAIGTYSWNYTWDSTEADDGDFKLYVRTNNGTTYSDNFIFPVKILNIFVQFSYPFPDSKVKGSIRIEGTISTGETADYVQIRFDEGEWVKANDKTGQDTWSSWYYELSTKSLKNGWHTISVRTHYNGIFSKETTIRVKVDNPSEGSFLPGFEALTGIIAFPISLSLILIMNQRKRRFK